MIDSVDRARLARDTPWFEGRRTGPCVWCGAPATAVSGQWATHDDTGDQLC
jgi:hypothetical protein